MKNSLLFFLIFTCLNSINVDISLSNSEVKLLATTFLFQIGKQQKTIPIKNEINFGLGKLILNNIQIQDLIFNEDLIQLTFTQTPKSITTYFYIDYFTITLNANIETLLNYKFETQFNLEIKGLKFKAILLLINNQVSLQNEKLDDFSIKSINCKQGETQLDKVVKGAINYLLKSFDSIINQQCTKKIAQFFKEEQWKKMIPRQIPEINTIDIKDQDYLNIVFTISTSELLAKIQNSQS
ncbi:unnamed protein product [Paramecium sonneborni]|uniref:Lipid-binding serum glycoprotein N-terminal domain-containing protein n=1 Tax=Paramecium sonneborni TaxID=65129 RepID=A0A8S1PLB2_9CILI|nr:unnamed protein product [Paramecium sonneborni]